MYTLKKSYFEIAFMNRFSDEKILAAWLNKDGPSSDFPSTSPNIICQRKKKMEKKTLKIIVVYKVIWSEKFWKSFFVSDLKIFSIRTAN